MFLIYLKPFNVITLYVKIIDTINRILYNININQFYFQKLF